jgi:hypothetical protein
MSRLAGRHPGTTGLCENSRSYPETECRSAPVAPCCDVTASTRRHEKPGKPARFSFFKRCHARLDWMSALVRSAITVPVLETERLRMRGHRIDDFPHSAAMWADPNVTRHIRESPCTQEESWTRFLRYAGHWALLGFGYWLVEEKQTSQFLGGSASPTGPHFNASSNWSPKKCWSRLLWKSVLQEADRDCIPPSGSST